MSPATAGLIVYSIATSLNFVWMIWTVVRMERLYRRELIEIERAAVDAEVRRLRSIIAKLSMRIDTGSITLPDHACVQCVGDAATANDGFVCVRHLALAIALEEP